MCTSALFAVRTLTGQDRMMIWGLTGVLVYEAVRVQHPEHVDGKMIMFIVAACGIGVNLVMVPAFPSLFSADMLTP